MTDDVKRFHIEFILAVFFASRRAYSGNPHVELPQGLAMAEAFQFDEKCWVDFTRAVLIAYNGRLAEIRDSMRCEFKNLIDCIEFGQRLHHDCKCHSETLAVAAALLRGAADAFMSADEEGNCMMPVMEVKNRYNPNAAMRPMQAKVRAVCEPVFQNAFDDAAEFLSSCFCFHDPVLENKQLCHVVPKFGG